MTDSILTRAAEPADAAALRAMQALSFRVLGAGAYAPEVIEAYLAEVGTLDEHLLQDGRYRVAVHAGAIVGCGGWSTRPAGYSGRAAGPGGAGFAGATVRAVYVHPDWARRGIARRIMAETESAMAAAGFRHAGLLATLSGFAFYRRLGYADGASVALRLGGGLTLEVVAMRKALDAGTVSAAA